MRTFIYPAKIERDAEGFFLVTFRDIPFAATDGKTLDEALENAVDCLCEALASCIADNEEIPLASEPEADERLITPTALIAAKAALYTTVTAQGLSKTALAGILGVSETVGRRLLDSRYQTKLNKIGQAQGHPPGPNGD